MRRNNGPRKRRTIQRYFAEALLNTQTELFLEPCTYLLTMLTPKAILSNFQDICEEQRIFEESCGWLAYRRSQPDGESITVGAIAGCIDPVALIRATNDAFLLAFTETDLLAADRKLRTQCLIWLKIMEQSCESWSDEIRALLDPNTRPTDAEIVYGRVTALILSGPVGQLDLATEAMRRKFLSEEEEAQWAVLLDMVLSNQ